jgi:hypothetical protein
VTSQYSGPPVVYCDTNNPCPPISPVCNGDSLVVSSPTCEEDLYCVWTVSMSPCRFTCADGACTPPPHTLPR